MLFYCSAKCVNAHLWSAPLPPSMRSPHSALPIDERLRLWRLENQYFISAHTLNCNDNQIIITTFPMSFQIVDHLVVEVPSVTCDS